MKKEGIMSINDSEGGRIAKVIPVNVVNVSKNPLPEYQTEMSAGMDLRANLESPVYIHPKEIKLIPTGNKIQLPDGFEAQIRPRSGLAFKNGITVLNTPGTVDGDFTGEIGVILINHSDKSFKVENGDRIAQMIIAKYEKIQWNRVESLTETVRGEGGFGHTGRE